MLLSSCKYIFEYIRAVLHYFKHTGKLENHCEQRPEGYPQKIKSNSDSFPMEIQIYIRLDPGSFADIEGYVNYINRALFAHKGFESWNELAGKIERAIVSDEHTIWRGKILLFIFVDSKKKC